MVETKLEKCAGFIVYKLDDEGQKYLLLYQNESRTWSFPKGHIEPHETALDAAVRELYEEAGLTAEPVPGFRREYSYSHGEATKQVTLFLTRFVDEEIALEKPEMGKYKWCDAQEVIELMAGRSVEAAVAAAEHYAVSVFLRELLNTVPCVSGNEYTMKEFLMAFLSNSKGLALVDMDNWFYAVHYEGDDYPWVAVRADIDAILDSAGKPFHGCGHDGHSAVVATLAALQSTLTLDKNIVYIFQPEEETGAGAEKVIPVLEKYGVQEIYGFHNIPGYEAGELLVRDGTFSCTSFGVLLRFIGEKGHAAYPEQSLNPCFPAAKLLSIWHSLFRPNEYRGLVKGTVVGLETETAKFGVSPAFCDVSVTLRAEFEDDLDAADSLMVDFCAQLAEEHGYGFKSYYFDHYPVTENDTELHRRAKLLFSELGGFTILDSPMPWSEDFGNYSGTCRSYYFGVGAGKDAAQLHTDDYEWNDLINWRAIMALKKLTEA